MTNLLQNPGFDGDWWRKTHIGKEYGEILAPMSWVAYWKEGGGPMAHDPDNTEGYGRPEMQGAGPFPPYLDPPRSRTGKGSLKYFTFWRIHDAGVYQRVTGVTPGQKLRFSAWAHGWSSTQDDAHISDGAGVGRNAFFALEGSTSDDSTRNMTFQVGIDPTGGTDPWASTVVWGKGAHIYNAFAQVPAVEAVAQGPAVTVFLRSRCLWRFKHNDVYWDDAELTVVEAGPTPGPTPVVPVTPGNVQLSCEPAQPGIGELFTVVARNGATITDPRLGFENCEIFVGNVLKQGNDLCWRCLAFVPGPYRVQVLAGQVPVASGGFTLLAKAPTGNIPK